ncbi:MAG: CaiB/BaiF CoA transferase family protein [Acidobacteriota bacterium]
MAGTVDPKREQGSRIPGGEEEGPLAGIRVLDLGRHLAGPTAAMWLGDLGADVIKVESLAGGDPGRTAGPPFIDGESAFFLSANRNKRSLALDVKSPDGQKIFRRLAGTADVVIENFRPGVMDALSIGYGVLSRANPRLIYCSITGFGRGGPLAQRPGLDQIIQGLSGLMSITGFEGGPPVRVGIPIADLLAGLFGAYGILAALQARQRTGRGQRVDTSLLESMVGMLSFQGVRYLNGRGTPPPAGNHHPILAPYGVFEARDGCLTIGTTSQRSWRRLCRVIGGEEFLKDPRFKDNGARFRHRELLARLMGEKLQAHTVAEWEEILNQESVPCGPIQSMDQALDHPQVLGREMVMECSHPTAGRIRLLGLPVKHSQTPAALHRPPPLLGQHTEEILKEVGLSEEDLRRLERLKVVASVGAG